MKLSSKVLIRHIGKYSVIYNATVNSTWKGHHIAGRMVKNLPEETKLQLSFYRMSS